MKRIIIVSITQLSVLCFFNGCKKNSETNTASLFKNTVWTGQFQNNGTAAEPYSMQCKEDGTLTWREYAGTYQGTWTLSGKQLTLIIDNAKAVKANVSDDKTLINIQNDAANSRALSNGELNKVADQVLDGTTWADMNGQGTLVFSANSKVTGTGSVFFAGQFTLPYSRQAGVILYAESLGSSNNYFAVLMADGQTIRVLDKNLPLPYSHPYKLTKQ